jgi:uncharacterized membrane protein
METNDRPRIALTPTAFDLICWGLVFVSIVFAGAYITVNYSLLPEKVPMHFDSNGAVDGYGPPWSILVIYGIQLVIGVALWILSRYPHVHNYMQTITEENAGRIYGNSINMLSSVNAICTIYFGFLIYQTIQIALNEQEQVGSLSLIIFLSSLTFSTIFFIWRSFRIDK